MGRGKHDPLIIEGTDYRSKKVCVFCSKEYFKNVLVNKKQWIKSRFCSQKCLKGWMKGKKFPRKRRKMTEEEKMRGMESGRWWGWNRGVKFSKEIKIKMSAARQGIDISSWKGFKKTADKRERIRFRREVHGNILKRDNFTCAICGIRGKNMQVDHIVPWAESEKLRFDMNNCQTLCMDCHYLKTFGKEKPRDINNWGNGLTQIGGFY